MHLIFVTHPLLGLFGIYSALLNTVTGVYGSTKVYSYTFSLALRFSTAELNILKPKWFFSFIINKAFLL